MILHLQAHEVEPGDVLLLGMVTGLSVVVGTVVDHPQDEDKVVIYEASVVPVIQVFRRTLPVRVLRGPQ